MEDEELVRLQRRMNWAIWLPTIVAIIGFAIWFFLFVILDFGG
jgi:hypothetical protein